MSSPAREHGKEGQLPLPRLELPRRELPFEPRNEAGVAILFGQLADDLGFKIVDAQAEVPDCTATLKGETVRIELEYSSKGFRREVNSGQSKKVCGDPLISVRLV